MQHFKIRFCRLLVILFMVGCSDSSEIGFRITEIKPSSDGPGAKVHILGEGFGNITPNVSVIFNGVPAPVMQLYDSLIVTNVPSIATSGKVTVIINSKSADIDGDFIVLEGKWTEKTSIPFEDYHGFTAAVGFASKDNGYIGTGIWDPIEMNKFWRYAPGIDSWFEIDPFPGEPRYFCVAFVIEGFAYVGLGKKSGDNPLNDFYRLDMEDNSWSQISDFPGINNNERAVAFSIGSKGYVNRNNEVWEYNPETDTWKRLNDFPGDPTNGAVGASVGEFGYLGLGLSADRTDWWQYNTINDEWIQKADFPNDLQSLWLSSFVMNEKIYLVGIGPNCWEYDPSTDRWTKRTSLPNIRFVPASFSIDGKGYVAAGRSDGGWEKEDLWEFVLK